MAHKFNISKYSAGDNESIKAPDTAAEDTTPDRSSDGDNNSSPAKAKPKGTGWTIPANQSAKATKSLEQGMAAEQKTNTMTGGGNNPAAGPAPSVPSSAPSGPIGSVPGVSAPSGPTIPGGNTRISVKSLKGRALVSGPKSNAASKIAFKGGAAKQTGKGGATHVSRQSQTSTPRTLVKSGRGTHAAQQKQPKYSG